MKKKDLYRRFYPIGIIYSKRETHEIYSEKIAVRVSKKKLKRAIDRNYVKRRIKEAYMKNKSLVTHNDQSYNIIFIYLDDKPLPFYEIENSIKEALDFLNSFHHSGKSIE